VANIGNNNKSLVNNGDVLGVLIQKLGGSKPAGGSSKDITTTINNQGNVGNAAGQATVGKGKPNQNNNQTFISQ